MNKETYLAALASWKSFINNGHHKKYKVFYDGYYVINPNDHWMNHKFQKIEQYKWESDLTIHSHIFYNLLRRRSLNKAFIENDTLTESLNGLKYYAGIMDKNDNAKQIVEKIIKPFGGHITLEDFKEIVLT